MLVCKQWYRVGRGWWRSARTLSFSNVFTSFSGKYSGKVLKCAGLGWAGVKYSELHLNTNILKNSNTSTFLDTVFQLQLLTVRRVNSPLKNVWEKSLFN